MSTIMTKTTTPIIFQLVGGLIQQLNELYQLLLICFQEQYSVSTKEFRILYQQELSKLIKRQNTSEIDLPKHLKQQCEERLIRRMNDEEKEWKAALKAWDEAAWQRFRIECTKVIRKLAAEYQLSQVDADDVFQEVAIVFMNYFRKEDFRLEVKVATFCYTIAKRKLLRLFSKRKSQQSYEDYHSSEEEEEQTEIEFTPLMRNEVELVNEFISSLDEESKSILRLKYVEGKRPTSICKKLKITQEYLTYRLEQLEQHLVQSLDGHLRKLITQRIERLAEEEKYIMEQYYYHRRARKDIAKELEIKDGTLGVRIYRIQKKLYDSIIEELINLKK